MFKISNLYTCEIVIQFARQNIGVTKQRYSNISKHYAVNFRYVVGVYKYILQNYKGTGMFQGNFEVITNLTPILPINKLYGKLWFCECMFCTCATNVYVKCKIAIKHK